MTAADIATKLKNMYAGQSIEQLGVSASSGVADLVILEPLHMIEIKARTDKVIRLPRQVQSFNPVFPLCSVACDVKHEARVLKIIPAYWGLFITGDYLISRLREPQPNPALEPIKVASQLFKEDLLQLCAVHNLKSVSTLTKQQLALRVGLALPLDTIMGAWLERLRSRVANPGQQMKVWS